MIKVGTFRWVVPSVQGFVRDLWVRWALEEAGLPYETRLIGIGDDQRSEAYLAKQPFGHVPTYEEDGLCLFESGAIVHHIAERSEALMPRDAHGRARTTTWMFAALNSIEPAVSHFVTVDSNAKEEWARLRRPAAAASATSRLESLSRWLGARDYLEDRFTAGDLLMAGVLRVLGDAEIFRTIANLEAYRRRCVARPAFQKALAAQMKTFAENGPERPADSARA